MSIGKSGLSFDFSILASFSFFIIFKRVSDKLLTFLSYSNQGMFDILFDKSYNDQHSFELVDAFSEIYNTHDGVCAYDLDNRVLVINYGNIRLTIQDFNYQGYKDMQNSKINPANRIFNRILVDFSDKTPFL